MRRRRAKIFRERKRIVFRRKRYPTLFIPRPDPKTLEDIESSFTPPKES